MEDRTFGIVMAKVVKHVLHCNLHTIPQEDF